VVRYLRDEFSKTGATVSVDSMGNLYAELGEPNAKPHLMIEAHSDEIGAIVRSIDDQGFLRFDPLGGIISSMMVGRRVRVAGHFGVVGTRPGHLQSDEERRSVPPLDQLYIDMGVDSAQEVAEMGIKIGSPISYIAPLETFTNRDRVSGKAIDNRIGCTILLQLFRNLANQKIDGRLTGVVAVQEEVGLRGATVAARHVGPDYAIVLDTVPIGDGPDVAKGRMPGRLGKGPVLVITASGRSGGHITPPKLMEWIEQAATEADVPLQRATSIGYAVTDAASIHLRRDGIPTGVIGLARRYSHTPICLFDLNDAVRAVALLEKFVGDIGSHQDLSFT
jgi:endoglucanase